MRLEPRRNDYPKGKKPERPQGLRGLMLYGVLTILGGLALVAVSE